MFLLFFLTLILGSYENCKMVGYKHLYFNSTGQMFLIWTITIGSALIFYEVVKYLWRLHEEGSLRCTMLILLIMDIYPHYYSCWIYLNYFNDDFYKQIVHQTFFTVTELTSSAIIVYMCSKKTTISPKFLIGVLSINIVHILIGGLDQFVKQLLFMEDNTFQRARSLGLLIPDVLHIVIPLVAYKQEIGKSRHRMFTRNELTLLTGFTVFLFLLGTFIMNN